MYNIFPAMTYETNSQIWIDRPITNISTEPPTSHTETREQYEKTLYKIDQPWHLKVAPLSR